MASKQIQNAVRAFRRALHANRQWFRDAEAFARADAEFDAGEFGGGDAAEQQAWERHCAIGQQVASRFGVCPGDLDNERARQEWLEHERMLARRRDRARRLPARNELERESGRRYGE